MSSTRRILTVLAVLAAFAAAACGDDDASDASSDPSNTGAQTSDGDAPDDDAAPADTPSGGSGGVLVLDGETIELDSARCFLEPQDSAGGGGQILATAQGFGTSAAGQDLIVDFTRYDAESMFHGDDISIDSADGSVALEASLDEGAVALAGSELRAESVELRDLDAGTTATASFSIVC